MAHHEIPQIAGGSAVGLAFEFRGFRRRAAAGRPGEHRSPADELKAFRLPPGFEARTRRRRAGHPEADQHGVRRQAAGCGSPAPSNIRYPRQGPPRPRHASRSSTTSAPTAGPARSRRSPTASTSPSACCRTDGNGAIVYSIPNIWRLRDTDGDGNADKREVLYSGFGTRDTHGMVNGFVRGFDGWVYACHGFANDSDVTAKDGSRIDMNSGNTFRFKPDGSRSRCLPRARSTRSACASTRSATSTRPTATRSRSRSCSAGRSIRSFGKPHDGLGFGPDMIRETTARRPCAAWRATTPTTSRPSTAAGCSSATWSPTASTFDVERHGGTYTASSSKADFLIEHDPWFRPVDIKLGPDGALYIADFYNRIIGHYEVPLDHPGRDRTAAASGGSCTATKSRSRRAATGPRRTSRSCRRLGHPNLTVRLTAMHETIARGQRAERLEIRQSIVRALEPLVRPKAQPTGRVHGCGFSNGLTILIRENSHGRRITG